MSDRRGVACDRALVGGVGSFVATDVVDSFVELSTAVTVVESLDVENAMFTARNFDMAFCHGLSH